MAAWDVSERLISKQCKAKAGGVVMPVIKTFHPLAVLQWRAVMKIYIHDVSFSCNCLF